MIRNYYVNLLSGRLIYKEEGFVIIAFNSTQSWEWGLQEKA